MRPVVQLWGHQLHLNVTAHAEPSFCFLPIAGLVVCCQGGRRADSSAPEAAAAVSADCSGAGAATQGTHTLKNTQNTHERLKGPVQSSDWSADGRPTATAEPLRRKQGATLCPQHERPLVEAQIVEMSAGRNDHVMCPFCNSINNNAFLLNQGSLTIS